MERRHAALDGGGAQAPSLCRAEGLAAPLLQRTVQVAIQLPVLPAKCHRQGIHQHVCPFILCSSLPRHDRSFSLTHSFTHALGSRRMRMTGTGRMGALSFKGTRS